MDFLIVIALLVLVVAVALLGARMYYRRKYETVIERMKVKTDDVKVKTDDVKDTLLPPLPVKSDTTNAKSDTTNVKGDTANAKGDTANVKGDTANISDLELFQRLTDAICKERLYLTQKLGRQDLMEHFHLTKERVGAAFSAGGTSVPEFIRECRLEHARRLMAEQPGMPLVDVAKTSGFLHASTFTVDFKNKFGVSPTQYREQNGTDKIAGRP